MAGLAPVVSQSDAHQLDTKMNQLLIKGDEQEFFTSYGEVYDSFDAYIAFRDKLLRGINIYAYGFDKLYAIEQGLFWLQHHVIHQAHSGPGEIATFCSGILQKLDYGLVQCQAMVLVPTRELAEHIEKVMRSLGDHLGVKVHACVVETSVGEDQRILSAGVHVVVGTPGRVFHMWPRQSPRGDYFKMIVLEEADHEMLSQGCENQVHDSLDLLPTLKLQVGVFSATSTRPVRILVLREGLPFIGIEQFYVNVHKKKWKIEKLCDLLKDALAAPVPQIVVFVNNTRQKVEWLTDKLRRRDYIVSATHGDMDQNTRDSIIRKFISGSCRVLITTDLLANTGIDIKHVPLVINYDLPAQPKIYLSRLAISRGAGRRCFSINFMTRADEKWLQDIQQFCENSVKDLRTWQSC